MMTTSAGVGSGDDPTAGADVSDMVDAIPDSAKKVANCSRTRRRLRHGRQISRGLHRPRFQAILARMTALVWFRHDLRLADNPALNMALASGPAVIPVYIFAPAEEGAWMPGAASKWWLHHSLASPAEDLASHGSRLTLRTGNESLAALLTLARECGATRVVWNRRYEPAIIARDQKIKAALRTEGIASESYNSALLHEPWTVKTKTGGPFQVFTPFWRHCKSLEDPGELLSVPPQIAAPRHWPKSTSLKSFGLLPRRDWAGGMRAAWVPGSAVVLGHVG